MIALMDCNNFFVSCERLFRPDLAKEPVLVLSSNDGCVVARSQEVKDLGIGMGEPYFHIKKQCENKKITVFSSNFALYRDISGRVMDALRAEGFLMHVYSVDEAFFEVPDSYTEETAMLLRKRVIQKTGVPVSIGIGRTKTLAKIAADFAKKGTGVQVLSDSFWNGVQRELSCSTVWGIGRQTTKTLRNAGIHTVYEFVTADAAWRKSVLGVIGERLFLELTGIPVYGIREEVHELQESYMSTRSFGVVVKDKAVLLQALTHHAAHIGGKLRRDHCVASRITILARGSRYGDFSHRESTKSIDLVPATNDTFVFLQKVQRLLDELYESKIPYKKAGVVVSGIMPCEAAQTSLFPLHRTSSKTQQLSELSDVLNHKFGSGTLRHGTEMGGVAWHACGYRKSPEYTTKWTEIALVRAS